MGGGREEGRVCEEGGWRGCGKRDGHVRRGMGVWEEGWVCEAGGMEGCGKRDGRVRRGDGGGVERGMGV